MTWASVACMAAAGFYGLGAVLQSVGARRAARYGVPKVSTILGQRPYLAGLGCDLVGWMLTMYAVNHLPLFAVHTILAGSVAVTVILAWLLLRTPLRRVDGAAIGAVLIGLVLVGLATGPTLDATGSTRARVMLLLAVPVAGLLGFAAVRSFAPIGAAMVAGLLFSLGAATVRTLAFGRGPVGLLAQPNAWAVPAYLGAGLVVHARSLQRGSVGPVTAALWATEILVAATTGYMLFGDRVRPGAFGWALVGTLLALGATVHLARSPSHAAAS